jgi:hypothetical protein
VKTQLQQLVPGAVSQSGANCGNNAIHGSESLQNSFLLNGADAVDYRASQEKHERRLALLVALLTFGTFPKVTVRLVATDAARSGV